MTRSARALTLLALFVVPFVATGCGGSEADAPAESTDEAATEAVTDVTMQGTMRVVDSWGRPFNSGVPASR